MSTGQKITFGAGTAGTTYSVNPTSFGFASGDNVQATSVPYQTQSTNVYGATTSAYPVYNENVTYGQQASSPVYTGAINSSSARFEPRTNYTGAYNYLPSQTRAGQTTKITFGGKPHSEIYTPIQQTTYVQPVTTYETYRQPTEIQTITSQPIREEVRYEQRVEPVRNEFKEEYTSSVPAPVIQKRKKTKKGGFPTWAWVLLGILILAGLIVGLVYLFGGFGGAAAAAGTKPAINQTSTVSVQSNATTTQAITNATTTTTVTQPTTQPTIIDTTTPTTNDTTTTIQPVITANQTTGTTFVTPTETTTVPTTTTETTVPTTTTETTTVPTTTTETTVPTTTTETTPVDFTTVSPTEDSSIEPTFFTPTPATTTSTSPYAYSTDYTTAPTTTSYDTAYATPTTYYAATPSNDYYVAPSADYISPQASTPVAY